MVGKLHYRERFALAQAHQEVDRPPMDLGATDMTGIDGGPRRLAPLLGLPAGTGGAVTDEAVLQALDIDIRGVGGVMGVKSPLARKVSETEFIDEWGIGHQFNGHHFEMVGRPLQGATIDDLRRYPWPDPETIDPGRIAALRERARFLREETPYVVCGRHPVLGVMELGCWMCGFDDFLYRMAGEPEFVHAFFERILAYQKQVSEIYSGAIGPYLHFTTSGDDFGTQTGSFISPTMFHDLVGPYLGERIRHLRQFTDAPFFHHSCGAIHPLIPELIRLGVDILNPIQPHARDMEPERLKADFGDQLTFYGGIDTQQLLPRGTPEEVYQETRRLIGILSRRGGYVLSAAHHLQEDVPGANVLAMFAAGRAGPEA
jgi:uroporphyrinogen decarboxylase